MTELPEGWASARLGELGIEVGGMITAKVGQRYELYSVPTYPTLKPELIEGSMIGSGKRPVEPGDVLICKINPRINRVWIVGELQGVGEQIASTEYLVLRIHNRCVASYVKWYCQAPSFRRWIELTVEGATGSHTRAKSGPILQQVINLPARPEQERIVATIEEQLSRLDAAEAALRSVSKRLEVHFRSSQASLMESSTWAWTTLGEIAELKGGATKDANRETDPAFIKVPYLRVANVQRGYLDLAEITYIRVDSKKAESLRLRPGDVLFNEGGDRDKLGRGWVWEGQVDQCIHQNHVFRARITSPHFDPYFLSTHANTWGQAWFEKHGRQTTNLASISLTTLKQLPVPAPSLAVQQQIVAQLSAARSARDRLSASVNTARRRAAALRRSILAAAFSGQLVPQDSNDEPGSVLLQRIRVERDAQPKASRARKVTA